MLSILAPRRLPRALYEVKGSYSHAALSGGTSSDTKKLKNWLAPGIPPPGEGIVPRPAGDAISGIGVGLEGDLGVMWYQ